MTAADRRRTRKGHCRVPADLLASIRLRVRDAIAHTEWVIEQSPGTSWEHRDMQLANLKGELTNALALIRRLSMPQE